MKLFKKIVKLLILDVDGVILDLVKYFKQNFSAAVIKCDLPLEPFTEYLELLWAGRTRGHSGLNHGIREFWPWITPEKAAKFRECFRNEEWINPYPPIEGSIETIHWFRERGIPVAVCTTNDRETLHHRFEAAKIDPSWFAAMSTWESGHPKPDPRALDPIFSIVRVPPKHAVYIGDWYPDLEAARGAGVRFVAVLSGGIPKWAFLREGVPKHNILNQLSDLPKLIEL